MALTFGPGYDWRGTKIEVGQTVLYGAPVGRSIAMVEAVVTGFTKSDRVNVRIVRRAYGAWGTDGKEIVHVGPDRLTVLNEDALPPTTLPTEDERKAAEIKRLDEMEAHRATHTLAPRPQYPAGASRDEYVTYDRAYTAWNKKPCLNCSLRSGEIGHQDCPGSA